MSGSFDKANLTGKLRAAPRRLFDLGPTSWLAAGLSWLRAPAKLGEHQGREQTLAIGRLALGAACLIAANLPPAATSPFGTISQAVFLAYGLYSLFLLVLLKFSQFRDPALRLAMHLGDIVLVALIFWLLGGSATAVALQGCAFFLVLLAAAYRWGLQPTLATAAACVGLLFVQVLSWQLMFGESHWYRFSVQALPLLAVAYITGSLGEKEIRLRTKSSLITQVVEKAHSETGLRETLQAVLVTLLDLFKADSALLAVRQQSSGRTFLWEIRKSAAASPNLIRLSELESFQHVRYFFPAPAATFHAAQVSASTRKRGAYRVMVEDPASEQPIDVLWSLPDYFLDWHRFSSLLTTSLRLEEWEARLFLFNLNSVGQAELRLLEDLVREVAPAVYSVYRLRRLRSRAGSLERARIARELHDTAVQALIGIDMQVSVLRRQHARADQEQTAEELARLQSLLRQEILNVRDLIQRIKPADVDGNLLLESLSLLVERFGRETGISARFVSDFQRVSLPPLPTREVGRILQEALVNVRKHSEAKNVMVRLSAEAELWKLTIEDDGRGFEFSGRREHVEMDELGPGPAVIKERVRALGGELTIESAEGRGARLEITLPYQVHGQQQHVAHSYSHRG